jgi:hypothetical protein
MMKKDNLLKLIAESAYNVGFGAKTHFATFDIVDKAPGLIGFLSMAVGVFALFINELSTKQMSATFIVLGIVGLYISFYDSKKSAYDEAGSSLTQAFNELKELYFLVKSSSDDETQQHLEKFREIEKRFFEKCISKQILFSGWYAHYKFFWQHQIEWVDEQKNFKFWRDKVPLSFSLVVALLIILVVGWGICNVEGLSQYWIGCHDSTIS